MHILSENLEIMLMVFLNKYNESNKYEISGNATEFPDYMRFSVKEMFIDLKLYGYILNYNLFISGGWSVIITAEAVNYFEKKGSRVELFEELMDSEKQLLEDIIAVDSNNDNISEFLRNKISDDKKNIIRGIIGKLSSNGLINVNWADNTVNNAVLTQSGRTYFEREKKYNEKVERLYSRQVYNNINATDSTVFLGNITGSTINIDNSVFKMEEEIENRCDNEEDKKELRSLLIELKEIIENIQDSRHIDKRKSFFEKITEHCDKHGWFYAEVAGLLGGAVLKMLGG